MQGRVCVSVCAPLAAWWKDVGFSSSAPVRERGRAWCVSAGTRSVAAGLSLKFVSPFACCVRCKLIKDSKVTLALAGLLSTSSSTSSESPSSTSESPFSSALVSSPSSKDPVASPSGKNVARGMSASNF